MKKLMLSLSLCLLMTMVWAYELNRVEPDVNYSKIYTGTILDQVISRLQRIEKNVYPELRGADALRMRQMMLEVYSLLDLIPPDIDISEPDDSYYPPYPPIGSESESTNPNLKPRPHPVPDRYPITPGEYENLQASLSREPFRKGKLAIVDNAAQGYRFSTNQIVGLLLTLDYSSDRLQALQMIFPGSTDPANKYKILEVFNTTKDKEEATLLMRDN